MKFPRALALSLGLFCAATSFAQTPAPMAAPTPKASAPVVAAPAAMAPAAKSSAVATKPAAAATVAAAGGGGGKVWVNEKSKVYHCEGSKHYGKTKMGEYMTEADAKTKGNHANHGKACAK